MLTGILCALLVAEPCTAPSGAEMTTDPSFPNLSFETVHPRRSTASREVCVRATGVDPKCCSYNSRIASIFV
jgi:hypothetical protein